MTSVPHSGAKSVTPGGSVAGGAVKERPILFSGPMVRALLDGRKTQTRRAIKPMRSQEFLTPELLASAPSAKMVDGWAGFEHPKRGPLTAIRCPYGVPGDRLWVREAWGLNDYRYERGPIPMARPADLEEFGLTFLATEDDTEIRNELRWRPSIHMPRWASRLTLEITEVRVERLLDCSEHDAAAEGLFTWLYMGCDGDPQADGQMYDARGFHWKEPVQPDDGFNNARAAYFDLWDHISGAGATEANPWVWVVSFRVLDQEAIAKATAGETRNAEPIHRRDGDAS